MSKTFKLEEIVVIRLYCNVWIAAYSPILTPFGMIPGDVHIIVAGGQFDLTGKPASCIQLWLLIEQSSNPFLLIRADEHMNKNVCLYPFHHQCGLILQRGIQYNYVKTLYRSHDMSTDSIIREWGPNNPILGHKCKICKLRKQKKRIHNVKYEIFFLCVESNVDMQPNCWPVVSMLLYMRTNE